MKADISAMRKILTTAIFEAFEKMFYIFLEPAERTDGNFDFDMETAILFKGALNGQMKIYFSRDLAGTMVKNLLNCGENEVTEKNMGDCTREAINVICGSFLTKVENRKAFDLSIPTFRGTAQLPDPGPGGWDNAVKLEFDSKEGRLSVLMTLSEN